MRFACLSNVAPGDDLSAQCAAIAAAGCTGLETLLFPDDALDRWQTNLRRATDDAGLVPAVVILGGLALYESGQTGWLREAIAAVAEVGAAVLLTPEYRPQDPLPLFPPYPKAPADEVANVKAALIAVGEAAKEHECRVLFEPLTPFEGRFWSNVAAAQAACEQIDNPLVGLALDFHNMNMTEASIAASILRAGSTVCHIHLADNNRRLPGAGHIDFRAGFAALQAIGYDGWYSFECRVDGDFIPNLRQTLSQLHAYGSEVA